MIDAAAIPQELRDRPQWLIWRFEPNPKFPEKKPLKMPYYTNGKQRVGRQGSDPDRASLRAFDDALVAATAGNYDGVGFAFLPGDGLIGIDIDKCIDDDGVISPLAVEVIELCGSYTEYSPSRRGFHIIVAGSVDRSFKSDEVGLEVFCNSQYFTFTGNSYGTAPTPVNPISGQAIERLRVLVKGEPNKRRAPAPLPPAAIDERAKLESALAYIDCDYSYRQWYRVGMALFSALGESGFAVWDYWSSKGQKYKGPDDLRSHWKSFGQRGPEQTPQAATIFHLAVEAGWRPPRERRSPAPPRPPVAPPPPLEQENQPGVPPGEQNQGEEQIQPGVPPGEENHEGPPPPANVIPIKGKRPSAREQYETENPPASDAAEGGGKGGAKKTKPARGQSFWDAIDHLLDNFVLLYGTDTAWDEVNRQQLKIQAVRLAFGSDAVKFWLGNSSRRMINFRNLVFDPTGTADPSTHVNLFNGFATVPKKGECGLIIDLLLHLCDGNEELASWITRWIAYSSTIRDAKRRQHDGLEQADQ